MVSVPWSKDWWVFGLLGIVVVFGYGFLGIESLSSAEAWARGVAQPYVGAGVVLLILALLLRSGSTWVRWFIVAWCPITITGGYMWTIARGVVKFDSVEFFVAAVPIMIGWVWFVGRMLFVRGERRSNELG